MSYEIVRRGQSSPVLPAATRREISRIAAETKIEQSRVQSKVMVGEFAIQEVGYIKAIQHQAEQANPDAAEAIALIVNITVQGVARRLANFNNDWQ
ncbi:hypothetical protein OHT57_34035 [Streptomyces sp. NBC_00285]|uniref:hypothetical protein n=1 Tax=Streptomyces sp. NBC_00285 TaxID=2975700 RepID=UPI002E2BAF91|nr:hypothetical protein [Streptomyces sp. NBC_00285]